MTFQITADKLPEKFQSFLISQKRWDEEFAEDFGNTNISALFQAYVGKADVFRSCRELDDFYRLRKAEKAHKLIKLYGLTDFLAVPAKALFLIDGSYSVITAEKFPLTKEDISGITIDERALEGLTRLIFDVELSTIPRNYSITENRKKVVIHSTYPADRAAKKWWKSTPLALLHDAQIAKTIRGLIATTLLKRDRAVVQDISKVEKVEGQKVLICTLSTIAKLTLLAAGCFIFWGLIIIPTILIIKALWIIGQIGVMFFIWLSNDPEKSEIIREWERPAVAT